MRLTKIGDWTLEERIFLDPLPAVVLFAEPGASLRGVRAELRRLSAAHPDASFYEIDLLENPSLKAKYSITRTPLVIAFLGGVEVLRHADGLLTVAMERALWEDPLDPGDPGP